MQMNIKLILLLLIFLMHPTNIFAEEIFLSLKKSKVNVRYGPSFESPIKFVYRKINLPIKQIDQKENWRRIIDFKNNSGWIHWSQLKPVNSVIPLNNKILFKKASIFSDPIAKIQQGRVLVIQKCKKGWCKIKSNKFKGWIQTDNMWGYIK
tara:strand:- start:206 stop:658 length:453 start_codon:yes stop_codon:yes gene_type:complete